MVLEAIEDHQRGWKGLADGLGGERVARGRYAIEHVMPRRWQSNWPLPAGEIPGEREALIHTLGNLTLLTGRLNSRMSNGPWTGEYGKRSGLEQHDVLMLNRRLLDQAGAEWTDAAIVARTAQLIDTIIEVWPVPAGHRVTDALERSRPKRRVEVADLLGAGLLEEGATLYARRRRVGDRTATVLPDGSLDVGGVPYKTPSGAARVVSGTSENGWWFWLLDPKTKVSLGDAWNQYVDLQEVDADSDAADEEGDDTED